MTEMKIRIPGRNDIVDAAKRIAPYAKKTPVRTCRTLNEICEMELYFKCENQQRVGAFKFRGASNAVFSLTDEEAARGVATHSSGNHAQALALAAKIRDIPAYIVMPENAPNVKVDAVKGYGASITFCAPTLSARESTLVEAVRETSATFIHPYDNPRIIAGQATAALELLREVPNLDVLMAPVGGGGLLSGTALAARHFRPELRVIAGEPANADDARRSLKSGELVFSNNPQTIADGLRTSLSDRTFHIIRNNVEDILTASENAIARAMRLLWERAKILVEPSAAVPLGALLENGENYRKLRIGMILSGGNVDLDRLPW